jgi:RimJ/RimL family protein N-acetyltransferase
MRLPYRDLRTDRLILRRPREGDAPLIFESFGSDPEVTRFLTWRPHGAIADAEVALAERIERLVQGIEYSWVLELSDSRRLVGMISAWIDEGGAELGFVLGRSHWNQGLSTEAVLSVTEWALGSPAVSQVWATCDAENLASARVLEKAGFADCGRYERQVIRPNLGPDARPSLLFRIQSARTPAL